MADANKNTTKKLADVVELVEAADLPPHRLRDMKSAIKRVTAMVGMMATKVEANPPALRAMLSGVRPAAHGITEKTWATLRSQFGAALRLAGVTDQRGDGLALKDPAWAPLLEAIAKDKRLSCGLVSFVNYCSLQAITPPQVNDAVVAQFHIWLEKRTLCPKPKDVVRRVPKLWNEASNKIEVWPKTKLTMISFKAPPKRIQWGALSEIFRRDADAYLAMRAEPDLFDERPNALTRPLAASTLRQQREHLRLAASVLVETGVPVEDIASLADLIEPERFKTILRHYHEQANRKPNPFVISLATTLIQVAQYYLGATADEVAQLKRIAAKLPPVPLDLTDKNKALALKFESDHQRAKLLFLPEQLMAEVAQDLARSRLRFVDAQVAIALDIDLVIPLRPQNLSSLDWRRHFREPDGPKGRLLLHIPAGETKSKLRDLVAEIPDEVAKRLRWYRRHILPLLDADPDGPLFVTSKGTAKSQETLSQQFTETIKRRLGIYLTLHQLRHLGAIWYLEEHPEDFETPRNFLGHAWSKTTRLYAGSSTRRASKAFSRFVIEKRDALKLKRKPQLKRTSKKGSL
jgi:integrase